MATEACCTPAPPATPEFLGKEETLSGHQVYATGSSSTAAVILVCDVFGYKTPLLRKLADKVAAAGYFVVVPDVLQGDPFVGSFAAGDFQPWVAKHSATGYPLEMTKGLVEALKDKGIGSIGAAGFCYGAKTVVTLAKEKDVKGIVQCHPSFVHASDYEEVAVPISVLASPTDGVDKYVDLLASRTDVKSFVKIFPDVQHGWTVRYDEKNEIAVEQANEAHTLMIDWFAKYL
jgi:dienelactone hydrolase